jgi:hypothetical protein
MLVSTPPGARTGASTGPACAEAPIIVRLSKEPSLSKDPERAAALDARFDTLPGVV